MLTLERSNITWRPVENTFNAEQIDQPCFVPVCSLASKESEAKSQWKLCFKLYCLMDTDGISVDSIEYLFLFEQVMKQNADV